jgi:hypothetical protein
MRGAYMVYAFTPVLMDIVPTGDEGVPVAADLVGDKWVTSGQWVGNEWAIPFNGPGI